MANWHSSDIPSPADQWLGSNMPRYNNPEYDALVEKLGTTAKLEDRAELAKQLNDMLMQDVAMIPLIHRGGVSCLLYTSPSPRDGLLSRMPSSA